MALKKITKIAYIQFTKVVKCYILLAGEGIVITRVEPC